MAPKRKSRVTKKRPIEDDAQGEKEDVVLSDEKRDEIVGEEQIQMVVETTRAVEPVKSSSLSVEDIASSPIAAIASQFWPTRHDGNDRSAFDEKLVKKLYDEVLNSSDPTKRQLLELSGYLENYLWPFFSAQASEEHVFSILLIFNEKLFQDVPLFESLPLTDEKLHVLCAKLVDLYISNSLATHLLCFVRFLSGAFNSGEHEAVKRSTFRYVSLPIWIHLSKSRLQHELSLSTAISEKWKKFQEQKSSIEARTSSSSAKKTTPSKALKKRKTEDHVEQVEKNQEYAADLHRDSHFILFLIEDALQLLSQEQLEDFSLKRLEILFGLLLDLLSQPTTRRYLAVLLEDMHFVLRSKKSVFIAINKFSSGKKVVKLLELLEDLLLMEVENSTMEPLSKQDLQERANARINQIQQVAFGEFPLKLRGLVFSSMGELSKAKSLFEHLTVLDKRELLILAKKLGVYNDKDDERFGENGEYVDEQFIKDLVYEYINLRTSSVDRLNKLPLYPTETLLWDGDFLPSSSLANEKQSTLALPKLNLQFLTMRDYFGRNFLLYLTESAYEIRSDIMDAVKRMGPQQLSMMNKLVFSGWSRMASPIRSVSVDEVAKPLLGEIIPRAVHCSLTIDLARFNGDIREEWEELRPHDVLFLVTIENPQADTAAFLSEVDNERQQQNKRSSKNGAFVNDEEIADFVRLYGVKYIRGATVLQYRDEADNALNDFSKPENINSKRVGTVRTVRVKLDPMQYYEDIQQGLNCYESFNLIIRRKQKENNFKSVLQTIRDLVNSDAVGQCIPDWLRKILLGQETSTRPKGTSQDINMQDTFLDNDHLREVYPNVTSSAVSPGTYLRVKISEDPNCEAQVVTSEASYESSMGNNTIRFTGTQISAIRSAMKEGLTLIVGPPGSGKTDCAVQIVSNLYHNHPQQKIVIVTHSNAALNDFFEKIMQRGIDPRHLLRLGSGEADLRDNLRSNETNPDSLTFSKQGRVEWCLARRVQLLALVQKLVTVLNIPGDFGSSCETADYFYKFHLSPKIDSFLSTMKEKNDDIQNQFPFSAFFDGDSQQLFEGDNVKDSERAGRYCQKLREMFAELAEYRPFELLRTQSLRADYLLTKQARIVAMTCTHAAMNRSRLVELGFKYDSVVIEEAGQILEVETMIPLLLQDSDPVTHASRLKRVVLLGDSKQLPPVVQHQVIGKVCRFEQSLFARLLRLGVPAITLDKQGRARLELAALYSWRYTFPTPTGSIVELGNLPNTLSDPIFLQGNAGFKHSYQFIDVPAFKGKGETCPTPFFYQNLGEAEFVVAVYQYMRLLGYPAKKISIITPYNGQKHLIRDILQQRCKNSLFGFPSQVTTVDKFQGQQNDYILLSLVRTESVGHLRDLRRLIVALSRARLGLYVFGRLSLFDNCFELLPAMTRLKENTVTLELIAGESYPCDRAKDAVVPADNVLPVSDVSAMGVLVYQMVQQAQHLNKSS